MTQNGSAIPTWPSEERPRERLIAQGPDALSDAELLAILLRTGRHRVSAVELARIMLSQAGNLQGLDQMRVSELRRLKGIGTAKAIEVKAALELGKRLFRADHAPLAHTIQRSTDIAH